MPGEDVVHHIDAVVEPATHDRCATRDRCMTRDRFMCEPPFACCA
jgi:hypothetical protein